MDMKGWNLGGRLELLLDAEDDGQDLELGGLLKTVLKTCAATTSWVRSSTGVEFGLETGTRCEPWHSEFSAKLGKEYR